MRAISRVADVSINTVSKLLADAGNAWVTFHNERTHRMTPAMAAGLTDKLMDMSDIVELINAAEDRKRLDARRGIERGATAFNSN